MNSTRSARAASSVSRTLPSGLRGSWTRTTRESVGMTSLSNPSRLRARSVEMDDRPVTFPPGGAETDHEPALDGVRGIRHHDRDRAGGLLRGAGRGIARRDDAVDVEADELGGKAGQSIRVPFSRPLLDGDVPPLDIAEFPQALAEGIQPHRHGRECLRGGGQEADPVDLPRRLRPGGERRGEEGECQRAHEDPSRYGVLRSSRSPGVSARSHRSATSRSAWRAALACRCARARQAGEHARRPRGSARAPRFLAVW